MLLRTVAERICYFDKSSGCCRGGASSRRRSRGPKCLDILEVPNSPGLALLRGPNCHVGLDSPRSSNEFAFRFGQVLFGLRGLLQ